MSTDILRTTVTDGIAVITLGSPKHIYFTQEMGDAFTVALDSFAGDPKVRIVVVTGGAPGYFNRHFSIPALIELAESLRKSGRCTPKCPPALSSMGVGSQSLEGAAAVGYARQSPGSPRQHGVASRFNVRSARNSFRRPQFIPEQSENLHLSRSAAN